MQIAKTIQDIDTCSNPLVQRIMNRSRDIDTNFANYLLNRSLFTTEGRRPTPAVDTKGKPRSTNLDLLSWMVDLYHRRAHIMLASYDNQLPWKAFADERHVGGTKRHGQITCLVSHRDHLSFSVQIEDQSVLKTVGDTQTMGATRTYMMVDHCGHWNSGWYGFDWDKTPEELDYLQQHKLLVDGSVNFGDYVHQNRRQSVYGAPYMLLKLLWQRIEDEIAFYEGEIDRLHKCGIAADVVGAQPGRACFATGQSRDVELPVFAMWIDGLDFTGRYHHVSTDAVGLEKAHARIQFLRRELQPIVQFVVRADEVAFFRFGLDQGFIASWVGGTNWTTNPQQQSATIALGDNLSLSYQKSTKTKRLAA